MSMAKLHLEAGFVASMSIVDVCAKHETDPNYQLGTGLLQVLGVFSRQLGAQNFDQIDVVLIWCQAAQGQ